MIFIFNWGDFEVSCEFFEGCTLRQIKPLKINSWKMNWKFFVVWDEFVLKT